MSERYLLEDFYWLTKTPTVGTFVEMFALLLHNNTDRGNTELWLPSAVSVGTETDRDHQGRIKVATLKIILKRVEC